NRHLKSEPAYVRSSCTQRTVLPGPRVTVRRWEARPSCAGGSDGPRAPGLQVGCRAARLASFDRTFGGAAQALHIPHERWCSAGGEAGPAARDLMAWYFPASTENSGVRAKARRETHRVAGANLAPSRAYSCLPDGVAPAAGPA